MTLLDFLFGCWHTNYTFPQKGAERVDTYVCCLKCGRELEYDFRKMKVVGPRVPKEIRDAIANRGRLFMSANEADSIVAACERISMSLDDAKFLKSMRIKA